MSLIANEAETSAFIEAIKAQRVNSQAPDAFYIQIMTRQKYGSFTNLVLFRKIVKLDHLIEEFHRATPHRGFFVDGQRVPHESLVCYMTPEPRDIERAAKHACANFILKAEGQAFNMPSEFMSECQKHAAERRILDVDVDDASKYPAVALAIKAIGVTPQFTIKSRGGYHLLCYDCIPSQNKELYEMSQRIGDIDMLKNSMVPVPGTLQGGVEVRWIRGTDSLEQA